MDSGEGGNGRVKDDDLEAEGEWTALDISNMKLVALSPNIAIYNNLTELLLQNNNLARLPNELFTLKSLRVLNLSMNQIQRLQPEIGHLSQLRELNLMSNKLIELPIQIGMLQNMKEFNVAGNKIRELPAHVGMMHNLKDLNVAWNKLSDLPVHMGKLFRLRNFSVEGNPLPEEILIIVKSGNPLLLVSYYRKMLPYPKEQPPFRQWISKQHVNEKARHNIQSDGFRVICYNIMAASFVNSEVLSYCPEGTLKWDFRREVILKELKSFDADILCLQEVEMDSYYNFFQPRLESDGYDSRFIAKSRSRTMDEESKKTVDGCATFWKKNMFDIHEDRIIEYQAINAYKNLYEKSTAGPTGINRLVTRDNVALIVFLKPKDLTVFPHNGSDQILVANTHIHWDPNFCDVKLMQVQMLVEKLEAFAREKGKTKDGKSDPSLLPMIICGDLNSPPNSAVYKLLSTRKVEGDHEDFLEQDYGLYTQNGLEHSLSLQSSYSSVCGEPPFTNYTANYTGVLDYIWFTDHTLSAEKVLSPISEEVVLSYFGPLPNLYMPSDHIPIGCQIHGKMPTREGNLKKTIH